MFEGSVRPPVAFRSRTCPITVRFIWTTTVKSAAIGEIFLDGSPVTSNGFCLARRSTVCVCSALKRWCRGPPRDSTVRITDCLSSFKKVRLSYWRAFSSTIDDNRTYSQQAISLRSESNSATRRPLAVRHQVGLKAVRVSHRHAGWVNVHDPVSGKYHRLREDEYFLLCQLDGQRSLDQLRDDYQSRYPNRRVKASQINALLFRLHESGLTLSHAVGQGDPLLMRSDKERRGRWIALASQWLFIRFPGFDPNPVMRWLSPLVRPILSRAGFVLLSSFVLISAIAILVHRNEFMYQLPSASQWLTMQNALLLAIVVGVTKIAHELGHAAVSERFGAKCRSIGPMLLVFTPALYCDTSASWMIPSRWKRASVALAGIATELVIASICVWVWLHSAPGLIHTIASHVMVVCGVSTIFFNANPLLRYDGYYLLSDLTDVPNLGQRANRRLSSLSASWFLGVPKSDTPAEPADESWWLLCYGIASLIYRSVLMFTIIGFIWIALRPHGLEIVGQFAAIMAVVSMTFAAAKPFHRFLSNPSQRRKIRVSRVAVSLGVFLAVIALGFVPLESRAIVSARIVPQSEARVFVSSAGQLEEMLVHPGQKIENGDVIARLRNPAFARQLVDARGALEQQKIRIQTLRQSQALVPEAADLLASSEETLAELRDEVRSIEKKIAGLEITAPRAGIVIAAPGNRSQSDGTSLRTDDDRLEPDADRLPPQQRTDVRLASWSGHPTDPENVNCFFEAGTELVSIADTQAWVAEAPVDSATAARVRIGAPAQMIWDADPKRVLKGQVVALSDERFDPVIDSVRRDHPSGTQQELSPETRFLVQVQVDAPGGTSVWPVGSVGRLSIEMPRRSLWKRCSENMASIFRFR